MDRGERLLDLASLLLSAGRPVPFSEIQDAFPEDYSGAREAAERKFERDKAELVALGLPLHYVAPTDGDDDHAHGYAVDRDAYYLPDLHYAPEELAALYAAGAAALAAGTLPFRHELALALRKIAFAGEEPSVAGRHLVVAEGDADRRPEHLDVLSRAVLARRIVHLTYFTAARAQETERDVDPYGVLLHRGAWMLVGFCHLRGDVRVFHLGRVRTATVELKGPAQFEVPEGFSARAAVPTRPWEIRQHTPMDVVVEAAAGAEHLLEQLGGERLDAHRVRVRVTFSEALVSHVLSLGGRIGIAEPAKLVAVVREQAERMAAMPAPKPAQVEIAVDPRGRGRGRGRPSKATASASATSNATSIATAKPDAISSRDLQPRLARLLVMVPDLARHRGMLLEDAALRLDTTADQLVSDLEKLSMVGRPPFGPDDLIDASVENGRIYVELAQAFSRPPRLTVSEALALAAAAKLVAPADGAAARAVAKLTQGLAPGARDLYARLTERVGVTESELAPALLGNLRAAAESREETEIAYYTEARGTTELRRVHPWAVIARRGRWYLDAFCCSRQAERIFRVDQILSARATSAHFEAPGALDESRFKSGGLFFPTEGTAPVVLRFAKSAASWARERFGAAATPLADGSVDVRIETAGASFPVSLALSFGGACAVVEPESVRNALRGAALRIVALHHA